MNYAYVIAIVILFIACDEDGKFIRTCVQLVTVCNTWHTAISLMLLTQKRKPKLSRKKS